MTKSKSWLFVVALGIGFLFLAIFSDLLRGRPFFLGPAQITLLVLWILGLITFTFISRNPTKLQSLFLRLIRKVQQIRKSLSFFTFRMKREITSKSLQITTYLQNHSIYTRTIWKTLNAIVFIILFSLLVKYAFLLLSSPTTHPWNIGDWLINYQGGFVRRGLPGEIFLSLSRTLGIEVTLLVVIFQLLLYLIFFICTYRLVFFSSFSALNVALIYSPAFMLFTVNNSEGSFRKEVLFFAFFSCLCVYLAAKKGQIPASVFISISIFASMIVLSHEMLLFYLPYVFIAFFVFNGGFSKKWGGIIFALAPALLVGVLVVIFGRGNDLIVIEICDSLTSNAPENCTGSGSIAFLSKNVNEAHEIVQSWNGSETRTVYLLSFFLSISPITLHFFSKPVKTYLKDNHNYYWLLIGLITTLICSVPLLWFVGDYGRIIYIHVSSLTLLALLINRKTSTTPQKVNLKWLVGWISSFIFIFSWRLIHWAALFDNAFPLFR